MKIDEKFIKNYKEVIIGAVLILLAALTGLKFMADSCIKVFDTMKKNKESKQKLKTIQAELAQFEQQKEELQKQQDKIKPIFEQTSSSSADSITSFGGMFEDMVDYVKMNGLKLRSVEYKINPAEDLIYSKFAATYNVCIVKFFVIGTYDQLSGLLKDLAQYPYFINVSEINILPYNKNKNYLLTNLSITLYSKKDENSIKTQTEQTENSAEQTTSEGNGEQQQQQQQQQ